MKFGHNNLVIIRAYPKERSQKVFQECRKKFKKLKSLLAAWIIIFTGGYWRRGDGLPLRVCFLCLKVQEQVHLGDQKLDISSSVIFIRMPRKESKGKVGAVISSISSDLTFQSVRAAFTMLISVKITRFPITCWDCGYCSYHLRTESWPKQWAALSSSMPLRLCTLLCECRDGQFSWTGTWNAQVSGLLWENLGNGLDSYHPWHHKCHVVCQLQIGVDDIFPHWDEAQPWCASLLMWSCVMDTDEGFAERWLLSGPASH